MPALQRELNWKSGSTLPHFKRSLDYLLLAIRTWLCFTL